jgi:hypothetical protein
MEYQRNNFRNKNLALIFADIKVFAEVAQLVERQLPKL